MTSKNFFTDYSLIGLKEAAELGGVSVEAICKAAKNGDLELLFEVPQGQMAVLKQDRYVDAYKDSSTGVIEGDLAPEYFVVPPKDCGRFIREPFVPCSEAYYGYRRAGFAPSGEATLLQRLCASNLPYSPNFSICIEADDIHCNGDKQWKRWVLWSGRQVAYIRVRTDDLYLLSKAFCSWRNWDADDFPNSEYFLGKSSTVTDIDDDFKSPQLLRMCEAAFKFWGNESVIASDPNTHPCNQIIIEWLLQSDAAFTKTSAENATALIKPTFGLRAGAPEKKK